MAEPNDSRSTSVLSQLGVMLAVSVVLGVVVAGLAIPFAGVLGTGAKQVADSMDSLPAELETEALPQRTQMVDRKGNVLATLYDENRVNVQLKDVSRRMTKAIIAIEDYRFYEHGAMDLKGTLRAFITNQANSGEIVQGGSSITQQMVKLTLVQQADTPEERLAATDDTYARKLRELRYAIAFEEKYSKDWILERYLNIAYFGDGAYGIQAAARHYFDVNAKQLNLRQSALLAGLVRNPNGYDPTNSPDRALRRRNIVLDRMADLGVITEQRAEKVKAKKLGLKIVPNRNGCVYSAAPFFCDYTLQWLLRDKALGKNVKERRELILSGGLTIRTTLDQSFQKAADKSVKSKIYPKDQAIGGLAMVEPRTGEVRAIAQSRPMGRLRRNGETYLNYVVPENLGDSAGFQAGSTFKPFVLAAAVNQGIGLNTQIAAPQTRTFNQSDYTGCNNEDFVGSFTISNSTGAGTFDLYTGTQQSVNTFYLELEKRTGLCEPFRLAKKMGVQLDNPRGDKRGNGAEMVPTFTLGVPNASPLEMAEAYATFAGRGLHCDSQPVTSIEDANGNELKKYRPKCQQVMPASTADAVNDVLRGVQETGFGAQNGLQLDSASAGKTGTTQSGKAVWFVGYTPKLSAAAMIAGANQQGTPISLVGQTVGGSYVSSASGSGFAGPVWGDAMQAIDDQLPNKDFVRPDAQAVAGVDVPVPSTYGVSYSTAEQRLSDAGFSPAYGGEVNDNLSEGLVLYTSPGSGSEAPSGSTVYIFQSTGYVPPPPPPEPEPKPQKPKKKKQQQGNNGGGNNNGGRGGGNRGGNNRGNGGGGQGNGGGNGGGGNGGGGNGGGGNGGGGN